MGEKISYTVSSKHGTSLSHRKSEGLPYDGVTRGLSGGRVLRLHGPHPKKPWTVGGRSRTQSTATPWAGEREGEEVKGGGVRRERGLREEKRRARGRDRERRGAAIRLDNVSGYAAFNPYF
eukprot:751317-Hanusia_phi.AAC.8